MAREENVNSARLLRSFERRFLATRGLRSFPWQSLEEKLRDSGSELLLDILQKTVKHPLCVKHPPSVKYVRCFLSELIRKHEAVHEEPLDELYEALAEVLTAEEPTQCHRSYLLPSGDSVTLSESTAIVSHGTTGLVTWNAALYLAEWAIENPAVFTHSLSLEPDATTPMQHQGHDTHNSESPRVTVALLDWDTATAPQLAAFQPDIVIAADVLYCPETILSLVGLLQRLSACQKDQRAPDAYVAFTIRNPETCQMFTTELGRVGIPWEAVPRHDQKLFPYEEHSETTILKLTLQVHTRLGRSP
ncbi:protein-lysine N-methyltransferase EEF2KMT isoform X2 [Rousettus aegyptiacus]|uniref:protein-lysine N-methyltransferase EEF2KMT isoform X2 n=1 Tax=Rousettus aegyptiacus TaxID=9407 RepID=UPI00168CD6D3|nr:protein-lysine N-methyltransferase EEF2KMT isoform X2 [Rousettus aegyptiacus]